VYIYIYMLHILIYLFTPKRYKLCTHSALVLNDSGTIIAQTALGSPFSDASTTNLTYLISQY
jgi:hypothetical protein